MTCLNLLVKILALEKKYLSQIYFTYNLLNYSIPYQSIPDD